MIKLKNTETQIEFYRDLVSKLKEYYSFVYMLSSLSEASVSLFDVEGDTIKTRTRIARLVEKLKGVIKSVAVTSYLAPYEQGIEASSTFYWLQGIRTLLEELYKKEELTPEDINLIKGIEEELLGFEKLTAIRPDEWFKIEKMEVVVPKKVFDKLSEASKKILGISVVKDLLDYYLVYDSLID